MTFILSKAKLIRDLRVAVDNGRAHSVCLDLPPELGTDMGPTALELGVMSFSGCFATIFSLTAKKMRTQLKDLEVELRAQKSEETGTIISAEFNITVKSDVSEDRIQRVFQLTRENCPVGKLLRARAPPGTPFEELPDDWVCPICGATKDQFEKVE